MIVELAISWLDMVNLIIGCLSLIALIVYASLTYQIVKDSKEPLVSFSLNKIEDEIEGHINFTMVNKSKVDVEVWSKVWIKINENTFSDNGFYGNKSPWVLQPFTQGNGHFILEKLETKDGIKLNNFLNKENMSSVKINIQIRYGKVGKKKWKKSSVHRYVYDFNTRIFWLDV